MRWPLFNVKLAGWMMNKRYDLLEICLKELENGASLDAVLARFPKQAAELRPILKASIQARRMAASEPTAEAIRTGRAKLLQHAAGMREGKRSPLRRRIIPTFQRLALSLSLTAALLLSGTGLVGASASALPGENLYPVKRTWEDVQLLFVFNSDVHDALKSHFETERLHEVSELLAEGRDATVQIAGIYTLVNGVTYISGLPVLITASTQLPAQGLEDGVPVFISGYTNANGVVEIASIGLLPPGSYVPAGQPVEMELTPDADSSLTLIPTPNTNEDSENGSNAHPSETSQADTHSEIHYFEAEGIVESFTNSSLVLNGKTVYFDKVRVSGVLTVGVKVEIKGYYASDGRFMVTQIRVKKLQPNDNNWGPISKPGEGGSNSTQKNSHEHDHEHDHEHNHEHNHE